MITKFLKVKQGNLKPESHVPLAFLFECLGRITRQHKAVSHHTTPDNKTRLHSTRNDSIQSEATEISNTSQSSILPTQYSSGRPFGKWKPLGHLQLYEPAVFWQVAARSLQALDSSRHSSLSGNKSFVCLSDRNTSMCQ